MSRHIARLLLCGILAIVNSGAGAAERLPKDGAWARYYVTMKSESGRERTLRTTVRFVGTVVKNGERLRWVEIGDTVEEDEGGRKVDRHYAIKFLISEKDLLTSTNPIRHFVQACHAEVGKRADKIEANKRYREVYDAFNAQSLLFLAGPSKRSKPTARSRTIDYQDGRLKIPSGHTGTNVSRFTANPKSTLEWKRTYEIWRHKAVSLGMASLKYRVVRTRTDEKGKVSVQEISHGEYTVEAWGTNAKTALPSIK